MILEHNLVGMIFGKLTVTAFDHKCRYEKFWKCKCDCGKEVIVSTRKLRESKVDSCGCVQEKELIGVRFGRLLVISFDHKTNQFLYWNCLCDCGKETIVHTANLKRGNTKSCGCLRKEIIMRDAQGNSTNLAGQRFGKLLVIDINKEAQRTAKCMYWNCKCDCGNSCVVAGRRLKEHRIGSCGCAGLKNKFKNICFRAIFGQYKSSAKKRNLPFELSKEEFEALTKGTCFFCGKEPGQLRKSTTSDDTYYYNGIDRLDSSKGYVKGNVVSCCKDCNMAKMDNSVSYFIAWLERTYAYVQENKDRISNFKVINNT
jgi:hypothetical protein